MLPETFILERMENGGFRFRLAGTRITEVLGLELRGFDFLDLWNSADRQGVGTHLANVTEQGGVAHLGFTAAADDGRTAKFEAVLLPLIHTDKIIDRIVGAISCISPPSWLGDTKLSQRTLTSLQTIWPEGRPHSVIVRGQSQAALLPHTREARLVRFDRRSFRVYDGGLSKAEQEDV